MTREIDLKAAFFGRLRNPHGKCHATFVYGWVKVWSLKEMTWGMDSWGRVMALFPVKNGPQYRSENQYRRIYCHVCTLLSPKTESRLYKPYRRRWMATKSRLKWFRKHPSTILFITCWLLLVKRGEEDKLVRKEREENSSQISRQFWVSFVSLSWLVGK